MTATTTTPPARISDRDLRLSIEALAKDYGYFLYSKDVIKLRTSGSSIGAQIIVKSERGKGRWRNMVYATRYENYSDASTRSQEFAMESPNVTIADICETLRGVMITQAAPDADSTQAPAPEPQQSGEDSTPPAPEPEPAAPEPNPVDWRAFKSAHCRTPHSWARWAAALAALHEHAECPLCADTGERERLVPREGWQVVRCECQGVDGHDATWEAK